MIRNQKKENVSINSNSAKSGKWSTLLRLIRFTLPYKWAIFLLLGLGFLNVGFNVLRPLPVKFIIDNVLLSHPLPQNLQNFFNRIGEVPDRMELLTILVVVSVIIVVSATTLSYLSTQVTTKVCQRLVHDLSVQVFDKMQRLSVAYYSKTRVGQMMQRLSGDTHAIYSLVGGILMPTVLSVTSLLSMFYIMAKINLELALISISAVPLFGILLIIFKKPIIESAKRQYELSGRMWSFMQQSLSSMKIIQAYTRETYTNGIYNSHMDESHAASFRSTKISSIYNTLGTVLSGVTTAIVVGIAAMKNIGGSISIGELFVFIGYIGSLFGPVNSIASTIQTALTISVRGERVFEILDSEETIKEKPNAITPGEIKGTVEFRNVSFGYGNKETDKVILHDFNFIIPSGKTIAIIGPTGAGKTSLISLLLRFYDPWEGEILIDSYKLKDLKLEGLRNNISLVLQDALIFPMSLKENIAFGDQKATMEEIIRAAKLAQAHNFIMQLPEGYDTIASEGGVSLSGGEKQRISLARAFLRKSPVLILDEPTSAMDVQTETAIFKGLAEYSVDKTVLIISHRLSAIRHADMIIAIKNGKIEDKGTHEALMKGDNIYSELVNQK
ncbi:MAG TPA: ABC transporter ATP-binding protein [Saprospiraceae bacterium]|nr:ABC transporter ATP-binding protein [Saprospiraceae bacterium]